LSRWAVIANEQFLWVFWRIAPGLAPLDNVGTTEMQEIRDSRVQETEQADAQASSQKSGNPAWGSRRDGTGVSGNPLGGASRKVRIAAEARSLASEYGGLDSLPAIDRALVMQAAAVLVSRPATPEEQTRAANTVRGIIGDLERRAERREASSGDLPQPRVLARLEQP
jgi:hypothetical protein